MKRAQVAPSLLLLAALALVHVAGCAGGARSTEPGRGARARPWPRAPLPPAPEPASRPAALVDLVSCEALGVAAPPETLPSSFSLPESALVSAGRRVDLFFVVDTTASMHDYLGGVKRMIASLADAPAACAPVPVIRIGLAEYRDRGDDFRAKTFAFTDSREVWLGDLSGFAAGGGFDRPESVALPLRAILEDVRWAPDSRTRALLFLFGDAPDHRADDPDFDRAVAAATSKRIAIHTVALRDDRELETQWKRLAGLTGGTFWPWSADPLRLGGDGGRK